MMQRTLLSVFLVLGLLSIWLSAEKAPNIILVLADDMGYSDAGCFGGDIQTPKLDSLAENGLRFTQMYSTGRCWPSRSVILTGYYAQQVGMDPRRGEQWPSWNRMLPLRLKDAGYRNYHSGKWHVKGTPVDPETGGFDRSYWTRSWDRFFSPKKHWLDDQPLPEVPSGTDYYVTTHMADRAIEFLQQHEKETADQPFFCYLAFFAPHFPLHALPQDIEKYRDFYLKGWDVVRKERWARVNSMGLVNSGLAKRRGDIAPPWNLPQAELVAQIDTGEVGMALPWDELTSEQQRFQATKMAIHAAMIDRMDQEIGKVMQQIEDMGEADNTVFLFVVDNGASGEIINRGDKHDPSAPLGSAGSYLCLGPGWSTAANTPFSLHKHWNHEGGISSPMIVNWPKGIKARGDLRHATGHFIDLVPTILDLAGAKTIPPEKGPALPGRSLVPAFEKEPDWGERSLFWAHSGNRALRRGEWKAVTRRDNGDRWELYNISKDRAELNDLAATYPEKLAGLASEWETLRMQFDADFEIGAQ
jgi:arylsulfatase